jgi:hypothetical protein
LELKGALKRQQVQHCAIVKALVHLTKEGGGHSLRKQDASVMPLPLRNEAAV